VGLRYCLIVDILFFVLDEDRKIVVDYRYMPKVR